MSDKPNYWLRHLAEGDCVDTSSFPRMVNGHVIIPAEVMEKHEQSEYGLDFFDFATNRAIYSIGRRNSDGVIFASPTSEFYMRQGFTCLWLR